MREIKLKYYCEETNEILPVYSIRFDEDDFSMITVKVGDCFYARPITTLNKNNLMQYTGVKDKNSKEIYEGDILERNSLVFEIKVDNFHGYRFMFGKDQLTRADAEWGEVIGNIWENPELLEVK